jgi:hypothetical protein
MLRVPTFPQPRRLLFNIRDQHRVKPATLFHHFRRPIWFRSDRQRSSIRRRPSRRPPSWLWSSPKCRRGRILADVAVITVCILLAYLRMQDLGYATYASFAQNRRKQLMAESENWVVSLKFRTLPKIAVVALENHSVLQVPRYVEGPEELAIPFPKAIFEGFCLLTKRTTH